MKETFILTKAFLRNGFRSSDKKKSKILGYIAIVLYFSIFTTYISQVTLNILKEYELEYIFIQILVLLNILLILMKSIVSIMNMFFFSNDLEYVLPLPVKEKNLYKARLNMLVASEYIFEILFFLAPLTYYGLFMGQSLLYFIKMLIVMAIIPIICCALISFIVVRVVSFCKFFKNKDRVQYMSILMAIVFIMIISVVSSGDNGNGISNDQVLNTVFVLEDFVNTNVILDFFVNTFKNFLILDDINIVFIELVKIIIFTWISYSGLTLINTKAYKKNLSINFNSAKKNKKFKNVDKDKKIIHKSIRSSYINKEWKMLVRVPVFFMQCIIPVFLVPIIIFMPFILNINNLEALDLPPIEALQDLIISKEGIGVIFILMQILYLMNINAVTAVSRDNKNAVFMKYIPVSLYKQSMYKIMPSIILNFVPNIYLFIVLKFVFGQNILDIINIIISLLLLNIFESICLVMLDIRIPKINWDTENTVVKQNMNVVIVYFIQIVICIGIVMCIIFFRGSVINSLLLIDVLLVICTGIITTYFKKNESKLFSKIY